MHECLHSQAKTCVFCLLRLPLSNERRCGNGQGLSWHTPGLKGPQEDEGGDGKKKKVAKKKEIERHRAASAKNRSHKYIG